MPTDRQPQDGSCTHTIIIGPPAGCWLLAVNLQRLTDASVVTDCRATVFIRPYTQGRETSAKNQAGKGQTEGTKMQENGDVYCGHWRQNMLVVFVTTITQDSSPPLLATHLNELSE